MTSSKTRWTSPARPVVPVAFPLVLALGMAGLPLAAVPCPNANTVSIPGSAVPWDNASVSGTGSVSDTGQMDFELVLDTALLADLQLAVAQGCEASIEFGYHRQLIGCQGGGGTCRYRAAGSVKVRHPVTLATHTIDSLYVAETHGFGDLDGAVYGYRSIPITQTMLDHLVDDALLTIQIDAEAEVQGLGNVVRYATFEVRPTHPDENPHLFYTLP